MFFHGVVELFLEIVVVSFAVHFVRDELFNTTFPFLAILAFAAQLLHFLLKLFIYGPLLNSFSAVGTGGDSFALNPLFYAGLSIGVPCFAI